MNESVRQRLFGAGQAFEHPVVLWIVVAVVAALLAGFVVVRVMHRAGRLSAATRTELDQRLLSWAILAPLLIGPVLLGAAWTILAVSVLSILCYREYARVTGLFRSKSVSLLIVAAIVMVTYSIADNWYRFFLALGPLTMATIAGFAILADQPKGYVQRVALAILAFMLFGLGLGHLGYLANDADYRPMLLLLLATVEMNDIFAYLSGRLLGRRKLCPNTSPNKTVGGALGALVLTTSLVAIVGHFVFLGGALDRPDRLVILGLIVSVGGQLGDLMLSSIKRDVGIKDTGTILPGHGGLLDRFDSLLLVAPAFFHYVAYYRGIGSGELTRILSLGNGFG